MACIAGSSFGWLRWESASRRCTIKMSGAKGAEKIAELADIDQLELRYKKLAEQLQALNREGAGFGQNAKLLLKL